MRTGDRRINCAICNRPISKYKAKKSKGLCKICKINEREEDK